MEKAKNSKNVTLSLPEAYKMKYDKISKDTHLSRSELLRRWIDEHNSKSEST